MGNGSKVKRRAGLVGFLVFAVCLSQAVPVVAGRGLFFRRTARSYGSTGAVAGSWGSHGASGGGRVTYANAYSGNSRGVVVARTPVAGNYASHGAAGGSPNRNVVALSHGTVQPQYPSNRVVVRHSTPTPPPSSTPTLSVAPRVSIPSGPVEASSQSIGRAPTVNKSSTLPPPSNVVVPPAPSPRKLARAAYESTEETDLAFNDLLPLQSIARVETRRHVLLKPTMDNGIEPTEVASLPESEVSRSEAERKPTLAASSEAVQKSSSPKTIATSTNVTVAEVLPTQEPLSDATAEATATADLQDDAPSLLEQPVLDDVARQDDDVRSEVVPQNADATELSSVLVQRDPVLPPRQEASASIESDTELVTEPEQELVTEPKQETIAESKPEPEPQPEPTPSAAKALRARLVLNVPQQSEVFLMGRRMVTTGETRLFNVPVGDPEKLHSYRIRVKTTQGHAVETTQMLRAGERLELTIADVSGRLAISPPKVSVFE